jgi:hypothetical protein
VIEHPPHELKLIVNFPPEVVDDESMHDYLWDNFHIDMETDPNSEHYEELYYNYDLRSRMGFRYGDENEFIIFPRHYAKGKEWSEWWAKLVNMSEVHLKY